MQQAVLSQLRSDARPNPPGRPVAPGVSMPAYQAVPGRQWDGAARGVANAPQPRPISVQNGFMSNGKINSSKLVKPWADGQHLRVREGQIMFTARTVNAEVEGMATEASMQHLGSIFIRGYMQARSDLRDGRLPDGMGGLTQEQFDDLGEDNIMEHMNMDERDIDDPVMKMACRLLRYKHFKYLLPGSALLHWNVTGGVENVSYGTSLESRINYSTSRAVVVNHTVGKDVFLSNIWGDSPQVREGNMIGLIVRRHPNPNPNLAATYPEIVPWAQGDNDTPSLGERGYYDERGHFQRGYYIPLGHVTELNGQMPVDRHRRAAIGNLGKTDETVHQGLGALPKLRMVWGV